MPEIPQRDVAFLRDFHGPVADPAFKDLSTEEMEAWLGFLNHKMFAFIRDFGFFAEVDAGYTPAGKSNANTEGLQVYMGMTYRGSL